MEKNILQKIDFSNFYTDMYNMFEPHFKPHMESLIKLIKTLSNSNFECYKANMTVIEERKKKEIDHKIISDNELIARTVGERRVKTKHGINVFVSSIKSRMKQSSISNHTWMSDDIVYSIGEMIDRLSIEYIKRKDYQSRNPIPHSKIEQSMEWTNRVTNYLKRKLDEIERKQFYEVIDETRTYNMETIDPPENKKEEDTGVPV